MNNLKDMIKKSLNDAVRMYADISDGTLTDDKTADYYDGKIQAYLNVISWIDNLNADGGQEG